MLKVLPVVSSDLYATPYNITQKNLSFYETQIFP